MMKPHELRQQPLALAEIRQIFVETYQDLDLSPPRPMVQVTFYRFVGINHTIRLKDGQLLVRLSDLFKKAPPSVLKALAKILLAKLCQLEIPKSARDAYQEYGNSPEMKRKAQASRRRRGRKLIANPEGARYNLSVLFDGLNQEYFKGRLRRISLGWSLRKSRRILGHFDPSHRSITISRLLDNPAVPEVVVRFILFHEMLHVKLLARSHFDIKNPHSRQFRSEERRFRGHEDARRWIQEHC